MRIAPALIIIGVAITGPAEAACTCYCLSGKLQMLCHGRNPHGLQCSGTCVGDNCLGFCKPQEASIAEQSKKRFEAEEMRLPGLH